MNNIQIISEAAVASGYFTRDEIELLMSEGKDIPFHTYRVWKARGLIPRGGEHGYEVRLWRRKDNRIRKEDDTEEKEDVGEFYKVKSFLFHISQCERIEEHTYKEEYAS